MNAAEEDHARILNMLLEKKVNIDAVNNTGRTALSFAAAPSMGRSDSLATLKLLLEYRADTKIEDKRGRTALQRAQAENRADAVRMLQDFEDA